jgi:resuscitation-promoting factor RpfA
LPSHSLGELVEAADPAPLLRAVDGLCADRDWAGLLHLRELLEDAVERGKALWPVTTYVEYRIALEAPGPEVARVLRSGVGRFALGPLTEVAAATHAWDELGPYLVEPGVAGTVAQERVLRGEDLRDRDGTHPEVLELPLALASWEPAYPLATYRAAELEVPDPGAEPLEMVPSAANAAPELAQPDVVRALTDLVEVWTSESNGTARAVVVGGGPAEAVATLGYGEHRLGRLDAAGALARMAWAAASGGAYGVRRGAALGRFDAWWAAAALAGVNWPADPDELGPALERLAWWCWDDTTASVGWNLRLAVADPQAGWAAGLEASDRTE